MALKLYFHPLASFCWKALIALYENDTPFEPHIVDLADTAARDAFFRLSPIGKMPVLRDDTRNLTIPEATIVIEYLSLHYPGPVRLVPADPDLAWQTRLRDRFYDLYVHEPMQRIVLDKLRPEGKSDPHGVEAARAQLKSAYALLEREMGTGMWAMGDVFSMADCAAAPALFYANKLAPFGDAHGNVAEYLERLTKRPSFARTLAEAQPYFRLFPG